jgi:2-polyprenyl-3-methyl-5-hydroxy-6-metoxy-1,4-benzoquinol methylase
MRVWARRGIIGARIDYSLEALVAVIELSPDDEVAVEEFSASLFVACLASMELANVELGIRLGLYESLAKHGPMTADELATSADIVTRYALEWLEQQAMAGVLDVDNVEDDSRARRFALPNAHAHVLIDDDSDACMKPCAAVVPWLAKALDVMTAEFRTGDGAAFAEFDLHDIQAAFTRPVFRNHLVQSWLPALEDVHARLVAGEPVRIADIGCGEGLGSVAIGQAFPNAVVDGFDLDDASIAAATANAAAAGLGERVQFHACDVSDTELTESYDLVMLIEVLHDLPDPVGALLTARRAAGADGVVLVADERTKEQFMLPGSEMERLFYAFSTLHCLSVSMQNGGAATGTVIRANTVRRLASEAGFDHVEVLEVEHPQFRLYRLS